MRYKSITAKIYISFFAFILSLMLLFITINSVIRLNIAPKIYKNNEETINKMGYHIWEDSALSTAKTLASQIIEPLYRSDFYMTNIFIEKLSENKNIEFIYLLDKSGVVVSEGADEKTNIGYELRDEYLRKLSIPDETSTDYFGNDLFCISHPVLFAGEQLGEVIIGFKADQIKSLISQASVSNMAVFSSFHDKINFLMIIAFLVAVFMMFYVVFIFNKYIFRPLKKLTERANEVANGSYDFSLEESYDHEFQKLNESFVTMIEEIYTRENELIVAYENIESEVRIRTRELQQTKEELRKKAFYDPLTGLSNRALCYDRLNLAMKRADRTKSLMAIMFLDLDDFKQVNDTLGHAKGDILLVEVAKRLRGCARETDTVCRLGGDEFVVIFNDVETKDMLSIVAKRITKTLSEPITISGHTVNTSTSIGITFYPDDGLEIEKLMKNADLAMYKAKSHSKGTFQFYTKEYEETVSHRFYLEHRIKKAVNTKDFIPHFQPVMDAETGRVTGLESLVRWYDEGQIYTPVKFLDIVEETGLMHEMTLNVVEASLSYLKYLETIGYGDIWLSLNISPSSIEDKNKISKYIDLIERYSINKSKIVFEITENLFISDFNQIEPVLAFIKTKGIQIALDDFGTGYSSLNYLNSLMPDRLKLDRSFVSNSGKDRFPNQICSSIYNLSKDMGMKIIAEGVETEEQLSILYEMGYRYFQGYYYSKPQDRAAVTEYIISANGLPTKEDCNENRKGIVFP